MSVIGTMQTIRTGSGYPMIAKVVGYTIDPADGRRLYEVETRRGRRYFGKKVD